MQHNIFMKYTGDSGRNKRTLTTKDEVEIQSMSNNIGWEIKSILEKPTKSSSGKGY